VSDLLGSDRDHNKEYIFSICTNTLWLDRFVKGNPDSLGCWTCMRFISHHLSIGNPKDMFVF